jgi:succinoglycan biosynthesis transport protein ExoP
VNARDYLTLLRERLLLITACVVVGLLLAAAVSLLMPTKYASTATFYVVAESATGQSAGASDSYQGAQLATDRVKSYTELLTGQRVAQDAAAVLGGGTTPEQVMRAVSATSVENTVIITLTATDTSPARAQQIATAVSNTFTGLVRGLETNGGTPVQQPAVSAQVLQPASRPDSPVSPSWPLNLAIGFAVGLIAGFGAAVLRRAVDVTVRTTEELEDVVGAAVLGTVPEDRNARRLPVPLSSIGSGYARAEAFHRIRTALASRVARRAGGTGTVLVVTSAVPGEGRTTTACNLAAALAAVGARVLLVDGDLRRPKVASYLELESAFGLTNVLAGRTSFAEAVQSWSTDGLTVLTSGAPTGRPNELVASRATIDLVAWLRPRYDYVIIDAPPLLAVADAANLAANSDGVVLVSRWKVTRRPELEAAVSFLRSVSVPVVGAILSRTPDRAGTVRYSEYVPVGSEPAFAAPRRWEPSTPPPSRPTPPRQSGPMPPAQRPTGPLPVPRSPAPVARPVRAAPRSAPPATAPAPPAPAAAKPSAPAKVPVSGADAPTIIEPRQPLDAQPAGKPAAGKPATDRPTADKAATDKAATDKAPTDKPVTDKAATDKAATGKPATDEAINDKPANDEPALVPASAKQPAAGSAGNGDAAEPGSATGSAAAVGSAGDRPRPQPQPQPRPRETQGSSSE